MRVFLVTGHICVKDVCPGHESGDSSADSAQGVIRFAKQDFYIITFPYSYCNLERVFLIHLSFPQATLIIGQSDSFKKVLFGTFLLLSKVR